MLSDQIQHEQLELFSSATFSIRLRVPEAMEIFWESYWKYLPTAKTTRAHRRRIELFFRNIYLDAMAKSDVENFLRTLYEENLGISTINKAHMLLTRMINKLMEYKEDRTDFKNITMPRRNPSTLIKTAKETHLARKVVVSPEEFKILKQCADEDLKDILNMLVWTRLRPSDLKRLTEKNVNWQTRQLEGVQHKTITQRNPSGVSYRVPLHPRMEELLRERIKQVKPGSHLFSWHNMQKRWGSCRKNSGMLLVQMRDLRRSAASFLVDSGEAFKTVSEGLGHTTTRTTEIYTPRNIQHLRQSTEKLVESF